MRDSDFCLAWLRRFAPLSPVLSYFEFPALPTRDRRTFVDPEPVPSATAIRRARLEHARRIVGLLEGAA